MQPIKKNLGEPPRSGFPLSGSPLLNRYAAAAAAAKKTVKQFAAPPNFAAAPILAAARTPAVAQTPAAQVARTPAVAQTPAALPEISYKSPELIEAEQQIILARQKISALEARPPKNALTQKESLEFFIRQQEYIIFMSRLIMQKGLNWIKISGNGNCFFLAVSFALTNTFPDIKNMKNNFIALFLRKKAVEGVIANADTLHAQFGWPQYPDLYREEQSSRVPRFDALSFESKKNLYKKLMSKYYTWAGDYESSALLPYLTDYCYKIYNYGQHVKDQPNSFDIDIQHNCDNPAKPILKLFHTGNHYDTLLTNEEYNRFKQLYTHTGHIFTGRSSEELIAQFKELLEHIKITENLAEIIRLEESINLIKIEILRRGDNIGYLNTLYNNVIDILSRLLEAQGAIDWEDSQDFAIWEAAEVSEKFSTTAEKAKSKELIAQLRQMLQSSSASPAARTPAVAQTPAAQVARTPAVAQTPAAQVARTPAVAQTPAARMPAAATPAARTPAATPAQKRHRTPEEFIADMFEKNPNETQRAMQLLNPNPLPERLKINNFLERYPAPKNIQEQANEIYNGYNKNYGIMQHIISTMLNIETSYSEIIPRYKKEGEKTMGGLIQSNYIFAADPQSWRDLKIKLIIQASNDRPVINAIDTALRTVPEAEKPILFSLNMSDDGDQNIKYPLTMEMNYKGKSLKLLDLIEAVRQDGGSVLVNCAAGMSRSAVIILMYLMHPREENNMSLLDALRFLKYKRPVILPNSDFLKQLQLYEMEMRKSSVSDELVRLHPALVSLSAQPRYTLSQGLGQEKIPGKCLVCFHQNPPDAKVCEVCGINLISNGGKRKSRRKNAKLQKAKSQKAKLQKAKSQKKRCRV